jgi:hypothetical protein
MEQAWNWRCVVMAKTVLVRVDRYLSKTVKDVMEQEK